MKIIDNRKPEKQMLVDVMPGLVFLWEPATDADAEYYLVTNRRMIESGVLCVNLKTGEAESFDPDIHVKVFNAKVVIS